MEIREGLLLIKESDNKVVKSSSEYMFIVKGFLIILFFDILLFIGPGLFHIEVLLKLIFWPIYGILIFKETGFGPSYIETFIYSILCLLGIFLYPIYPRSWTRILSVLAMFFWWLLGTGIAFMGV